MDYKKIKVEVTDGVAVVTMSDPTTMNAAGLDLAGELSHALSSIGAGKDGADHLRARHGAFPSIGGDQGVGRDRLRRRRFHAGGPPGEGEGRP